MFSQWLIDICIICQTYTLKDFTWIRFTKRFFGLYLMSTAHFSKLRMYRSLYLMSTEHFSKLRMYCSLYLMSTEHFSKLRMCCSLYLMSTEHFFKLRMYRSLVKECPAPTFDPTFHIGSKFTQISIYSIWEFVQSRDCVHCKKCNGCFDSIWLHHFSPNCLHH